MEIGRTNEKCVHRAVVLANVMRHKLVTVEHLLLSLFGEWDVVAVFVSHGVSISKMQEKLHTWIDIHVSKRSIGENIQASPTISHVQILNTMYASLEKRDSSPLDFLHFILAQESPGVVFALLELGVEEPTKKGLGKAQYYSKEI